MSLLTPAALKRIENQYPDGIKAAVVVKIFRDKGVRFSEATLRKYVQLGLLPTSRRVGIRGKHRGSSGLYPVAIVRMANAVKAALAEGGSLTSIRGSTLGLAGDVAQARRALRQLSSRLAAAVASGPSKRRRELATRLRALEQDIRGLEQFIEQLDIATAA